MREGELVAKAGRKFKATTDSRNTSFGAPDLVQRQFSASAPNRLWCSDLSHLRTPEGWLYLVSVIDVFARQIVGWSTGTKMTAELVKTAIKRALMKRRPQRGLIFHSDQGCQYVSGPVRKILERHGVRQSMGTRGDCYDNALVESFWDTLKLESINGEPIVSRLQTIRTRGDYIAQFYNRRRSYLL